MSDLFEQMQDDPEALWAHLKYVRRKDRAINCDEIHTYPVGYTTDAWVHNLNGHLLISEPRVVEFYLDIAGVTKLVGRCTAVPNPRYDYGDEASYRWERETFLTREDITRMRLLLVQ